VSFYRVAMKRYLSRLVAIVCAVMIGLTGFAGYASADSLTGKYKEDTLTLIGSMRSAIEATSDNPDRMKLQADARVKINDFASRYRRNGSVMKLSSFTTMRTALNSLAGHYSSMDEFKMVEVALNRGA
jgi:photosystem II Psb27 protein